MSVASLLDRLRAFVAIRSESADPAFRQESLTCAAWLADWLKEIGATVTLHRLPDVNPIIVARLGSDPEKKTVLFYGHYDVQPADKADGWRTDPWTLSGPDEDGYIYGRGVIDDKGQIVSVISAAQEYGKKSESLPVNIVFLLEGMEESGSEGLEEFIAENADDLLKDVSSVLICDTEWLGEETPTVVHALRGLNYFEVTVRGPAGDLHSGGMGGSAWEPLKDIVYLFAQLTDGPNGRILIPGFADDLMPLSEEWRCQLNASAFDVRGYVEKNGLPALAVEETPADIVTVTAFRPTCTIHGFGKVFAGPGAKTVIPGTAVGYFSTRLVPFQDVQALAQKTLDYLNKKFEQLGSPNTIEIKLLSSGNWWYVDPKSEEISAAIRALSDAFGVQAVPMAEGGSIPVAHLFHRRGLPVVLLSLGKAYASAHGPNERHHIDCLTKGVEAVKRYWETL